MIEPTDEMVEAYREHGYCGRPSDQIRAGLAAVLAIVERDLPCVHPYAAASAGPAGSVVCSACGDYIIPPRGSR